MTDSLSYLVSVKAYRWLLLDARRHKNNKGEAKWVAIGNPPGQ
jgi:hypothetical protein